jgi:hypothetical protein
MPDDTYRARRPSDGYSISVPKDLTASWHWHPGPRSFAALRMTMWIGHRQGFSPSCYPRRSSAGSHRYLRHPRNWSAGIHRRGPREMPDDTCRARRPSDGYSISAPKDLTASWHWHPGHRSFAALRMTMWIGHRQGFSPSPVIPAGRQRGAIVIFVIPAIGQRGSIGEDQERCPLTHVGQNGHGMAT